MNPNAKITDEQFRGISGLIRELGRGPSKRFKVEVTNTSRRVLRTREEERSVSFLSPL